MSNAQENTKEPQAGNVVRSPKINDFHGLKKQLEYHLQGHQLDIVIGVLYSMLSEAKSQIIPVKEEHDRT